MDWERGRRSDEEEEERGWELAWPFMREEDMLAGSFRTSNVPPMTGSLNYACDSQIDLPYSHELSEIPIVDPTTACQLSYFHYSFLVAFRPSSRVASSCVTGFYLSLLSIASIAKPARLCIRVIALDTR